MSYFFCIAFFPSNKVMCWSILAIFTIIQTLIVKLKHLLTGPLYYNFFNRVIGALVNNEDFSRAFGCPAGSRMNPSNKCLLW